MKELTENILCGLAGLAGLCLGAICGMGFWDDYNIMQNVNKEITRERPILTKSLNVNLCEKYSYDNMKQFYNTTEINH